MKGSAIGGRTVSVQGESNHGKGLLHSSVATVAASQLPHTLRSWRGHPEGWDAAGILTSRSLLSQNRCQRNPPFEIPQAKGI